MVVQTADIKFEMVAILYNIGALHSQLGAGDDRMSPEGLKMACTHFQCAAWSFQVSIKSVIKLRELFYFML